MILKIANKESTKIVVTNEHPSTTYPILITAEYPSKLESSFYVQLSISETKALIDMLALLVSESH